MRQQRHIGNSFRDRLAVASVLRPRAHSHGNQQPAQLSAQKELRGSKAGNQGTAVIFKVELEAISRK
jgi:hypothetical protein